MPLKPWNQVVTQYCVSKSHWNQSQRFFYIEIMFLFFCANFSNIFKFSISRTPKSIWIAFWIKNTSRIFQTPQSFSQALPLCKENLSRRPHRWIQEEERKIMSPEYSNDNFNRGTLSSMTGFSLKNVASFYIIYQLTRIFMKKI